MSRPNVSLRSNVMVGTLEALRRDPKLRQTVRGRRAIRQLMNSLGAEPSLHHLSARQLAELHQDHPCSSCLDHAVGPVVKDGRVVLEVRCPKGTCGMPSTARSVALDERALSRLVALSRNGDMGRVIDGLLLGATDLSVGRHPDGPVRPIPVRLSQAAHFLVLGLSVPELSGIVAALLDAQS